MNEEVLRFGPEDGIFGLWTPAEGGAPGRPAVLLLNAGLIHHVGPFDWYVALARRLARQGFACLRLDLSGIGESEPRPGGGSELDRALLDLRDVLDGLAARKGVARFVLLGLCSGAFFAHHTAVRDPRVAAAVFLDGFGYRTAGYYLRHYARRLLRPRAWANAFARGLRRFRTSPPAGAEVQTPYFIDFPPRQQVRAELAHLLQRGVRLYFVYTGTLAYQYFNHRRQFREMFGRLEQAYPGLQVDYRHEADHLFSARTHRLDLFVRIERWLQGSFTADRQG